MNEQWEDNNLMAIGGGLSLLASQGYQNVSVTNEAIFAGDSEVSLEVGEILAFNRWYFDTEMNTWRFDLSQLEE